jgi:hypothetical protein
MHRAIWLSGRLGNAAVRALREAASLVSDWTDMMLFDNARHCERSEATQGWPAPLWIASLCSQ